MINSKYVKFIIINGEMRKLMIKNIELLVFHLNKKAIFKKKKAKNTPDGIRTHAIRFEVLYAVHYTTRASCLFKIITHNQFKKRIFKI